MTSDRLRQCSVSFLSAVIVNAMTVSFVKAGDVADFKSPLDNSPMTFELQPGEVETPAVKKFKDCIVCHGADGTGKMGPTLIGKDVVYKQVLTDPGMFSIIYGGANGAMQSFHRRGMKQDEMLRIVAYVRTLDK